MMMQFCVRIDETGPVLRPCIVTKFHKDGTADVVIFDAASPGREMQSRIAAPSGGITTPGWFADGPMEPNARSDKASKRRK